MMETEKKTADEKQTRRKSVTPVDAKEPESAFGVAFGIYLAVLFLGVLLLSALYYLFAL